MRRRRPRKRVRRATPRPERPVVPVVPVARSGMGRGGGRAASAITLASTDVAVVKRETIEAGIPITGDLHPIETIGVRARIEGDLVGVFVREGERVASGQLLAQFESSEQETTLSSAQADVASAKSDLATAQWNLDQSKDLFKAGAIAERDLKVAEQAVESAKARLAADRSTPQVVEQRHARHEGAGAGQRASSRSGSCRMANESRAASSCSVSCATTRWSSPPPFRRSSRPPSSRARSFTSWPTPAASMAR